MLSAPHRVMDTLAQTYGPVMRVRAGFEQHSGCHHCQVMLGGQEWIVLSGLEEVHQFTSKDHHHLAPPAPRQGGVHRSPRVPNFQPALLLRPSPRGHIS